jgi:AcrR family transcriptional regulator
VTRQRLLDTAFALFAERGFHATTYDEIADAADMARATVFNYFPRKDDLIMGIAQERRAAAAVILRNDLDMDAPTATVLRDMLRHVAELYEADRARNQAFVRCTLQAGSALIPGWFDSAELFTTAIAAGQARGDVRLDLDPSVAGALLLDGYLGILTRWASPGSTHLELEPGLTTMLDTVLNGIAPS